MNPAPLNWADIEADYRAGVLSVRAIARKHGTSDTMIRNRAMAEGWERAKPEIGTDVARMQNFAPLAVCGAVDHKRLVTQGRALISRMMSELDAAMTHAEDLEAVIIEETARDTDGRRRAAMMYAVGLPARAVVLKNLAAAVKALADAPTPARKGLPTMEPLERKTDRDSLEYLLQ